MFSIFIHNRSLYSAFGFDPKLASPSLTGNPQPILIGFMLFQLVLGPIDTAVTFGINALTRRYEYQAGQSSFVAVRQEGS
jgi:STE24 endopeptidase